MIWFVIVRLGQLLATVIVTALLAYWLCGSTPGTGEVTGGAFGWLGHLLVGDFGSTASGSIGNALGGGLAVTIPLVLLAMLLAAAIGGGVGWAAAMRSGSPTDRTLGALAAIGVAIPSFWLGMLLVVVFASSLHWLPAAGFVPWQANVLQVIASLLLPALALAGPAAAAIAFDARTALSRARLSLPVEAAQLRGLDAAAAFRQHGLRLALIELAPRLWRQAAAIIAGSMIVENVFSLPGLGRLILDAVIAHDDAVLRAGLLVLVLLIAGTVFLIRVGAGSVDPRLTAETPE
jgi:peptide/nickel transport system permease protein